MRVIRGDEDHPAQSSGSDGRWLLRHLRAVAVRPVHLRHGRPRAVRRVGVQREHARERRVERHPSTHFLRRLRVFLRRHRLWIRVFARRRWDMRVRLRGRPFDRPVVVVVVARNRPRRRRRLVRRARSSILHPRRPGEAVRTDAHGRRPRVRRRRRADSDARIATIVIVP